MMGGDDQPMSTDPISLASDQRRPHVLRLHHRTMHSRVTPGEERFSPVATRPYLSGIVSNVCMNVRAGSHIPHLDKFLSRRMAQAVPRKRSAPQGFNTILLHNTLGH